VQLAPAVLNAIDERLRVFDAHTERERLRLEPHPGFEQELEHVARGVAGGEHHGVGADFGAVRESHPGDATRVTVRARHEARDARAEAKALPHADEALA